MFGLFYGLWRCWFDKEEKKLIIIGLDYAGKTTILEQYKAIFGEKSMDLNKIPPTIGMNIARVVVDNFVAIIWDVGGGSSMRRIWKNYYPDVEGVLFVIDSSDRGRFTEAKRALEQVLETHELRSDVPVLLFANKQDLEDAAPPEEIHRLFDWERHSMGRPFHLLPCCALNKTNLREGLMWLLSEMPSVADPRSPTGGPSASQIPMN